MDVERPAPSVATPAVVLLGATATGKTAVAAALARRCNGEIISADSRAFFRGLDIVTDKPSRRLRAEIPHHLVDIVDITESYDAMQFREAVRQLLGEIRARHRLPIIVGGGTIYIGALLHGLFPGPSADAALRKVLARQSAEALHRRLADVDPEAAARIHPHDRLRVQRALEVHTLTGRRISDLQRRAAPLPGPFAVFGLTKSPALHRQDIVSRVHRMIEHGVIDEVRRLREAGLDPLHQAGRTAGVPEILSYLDGTLGAEDLAERIAARTRSLARRQAAWFRRIEGVCWFEVADESADVLAERIRLHLAGPEGESGDPKGLR